ncbi:MAG: hypothetical protein F6J98_01475 [Moorea sp. SIO4G2]|nr:hypothetical protein [Moorena sp. SIO4G2]
MEWHNSKSILTDWCVDWWDGSLAKETPEEEVQSFRAILTQNLYRAIATKKDEILLDCDYEPSGLLEKSSKEACLDFSHLPKKTIMILTADPRHFGNYEVHVKYGYRGAWKILRYGKWYDLYPSSNGKKKKFYVYCTEPANLSHSNPEVVVIAATLYYAKRSARHRNPNYPELIFHGEDLGLQPWDEVYFVGSYFNTQVLKEFLYNKVRIIHVYFNENQMDFIPQYIKNGIVRPCRPDPRGGTLKYYTAPGMIYEQLKHSGRLKEIEDISVEVNRGIDHVLNTGNTKDALWAYSDLIAMAMDIESPMNLLQLLAKERR